MIDLNADLGEGFGIWRLGDDMALLDIVTSANVACGFHAGDPVTIRRTCAAAVDRGVTIGAQVSYRDLAALRAQGDGRGAGGALRRGALPARRRRRHRAGDGRPGLLRQAARRALQPDLPRPGAGRPRSIDAVADYDPSLPVLTLPGSVVHEVAAAEGVPTVSEAFADRAYTSAGRAGLAARARRGDPRRRRGLRPRRADGGRAGGDRRRRHRRFRSPPARSACTATPRTRCAWRRAVRDGLLEAGVVLQAFA